MDKIFCFRCHVIITEALGRLLSYALQTCMTSLDGNLIDCVIVCLTTFVKSLKCE